jgi:hypothetical protein
LAGVEPAVDGHDAGDGPHLVLDDLELGRPPHRAVECDDAGLDGRVDRVVLRDAERIGEQPADVDEDVGVVLDDREAPVPPRTMCSAASRRSSSGVMVSGAWVIRSRAVSPPTSRIRAGSRPCR